MATHTGTAVNVYNGTLTANAGDIDIITITGGGAAAQTGGGIPAAHDQVVRIYNRHATAALWFRFAVGDDAEDPVPAEAENYYIPGGGSLYLDINVVGAGDLQVKLISGTSATANPYTIMVLA